MKPEYYIYSWQAGAFRSDELSKSLKGYSCRDTAERIAKLRFDGIHDRIRYCVALTDDEAFVEMTRQNMPICGTCLSNHYIADGIAYSTDHCTASEWRNPSEKKCRGFFGRCFINYYDADGDVYRADNVSMKRPCSVKEFIEDILSQFPNEWGHILLHKCGEIGEDNVVQCVYEYGHLKTSLPEKYMNREVYMAEAWAGFPRMDITLTLQTKGCESWNVTENKEGGTLK